MANAIYKDLDLSMRMHPITGDLLTKTDDEAIKQSVTTLVMTKMYERSMHPEKGCQVHGLLFEIDDAVTRLTMEQTISNVLAKYEPRINVTEISITSDDQNSVDIMISYTILSYRKDAKVSLLLNRIR